MSRTGAKEDGSDVTSSATKHWTWVLVMSRRHNAKFSRLAVRRMIFRVELTSDKGESSGGGGGVRSVGTRAKL